MDENPFGSEFFSIVVWFGLVFHDSLVIANVYVVWYCMWYISICVRSIFEGRIEFLFDSRFKCRSHLRHRSHDHIIFISVLTFANIRMRMDLTKFVGGKYHSRYIIEQNYKSDTSTNNITSFFVFFFCLFAFFVYYHFSFDK